jgi:hypothetical protein
MPTISGEPQDQDIRDEASPRTTWNFMSTDPGGGPWRSQQAAAEITAVT